MLSIGTIAPGFELDSTPDQKIKFGELRDRKVILAFLEGTISLGGLYLIRAKDYDEAVEIANGSPIIQYGAIVEVRKEPAKPDLVRNFDAPLPRI